MSEKLILFDFDGTLVDSEALAAEVFPSVWSSMGLPMTAEYFLCNFVGVASDSEFVKKTLSVLPANAMEIADRKFDEELEKSLQAVRGMSELLRQIPQQVCVASNSSFPYLQRALLKTQLSEFFGDRVYSARDLPNPKPAPDVFLHAAKTLGFSPESCLVVEDSVAGIQAAQNAGMRVIGFMGGLHCNSAVRERILGAKADAYCDSAAQLKEILLNLE